MLTNSITADDFPEIRWRGHWIWIPEEPVVPSRGWSGEIDMQARESHGLFRKAFSLERLPEWVPTRITADLALYPVRQQAGGGARPHPQPVPPAALRPV